VKIIKYPIGSGIFADFMGNLELLEVIMVMEWYWKITLNNTKNNLQ